MASKITDPYSLRRDRTEAVTLLRWLGLAFALGVGVFLGCRIFLLPQTALDQDPTAAPSALPTFSNPGAAVPIPSTGTPANSLGQAVQVGLPAPGFTLPSLGGDQISLAMFRGSAVLINFWTTWCPPCKKEMPALQQVYERYNDQGFTVLGVNWTRVDDYDKIEPFMRELGLSFPILLDEHGEVSEGLYNLLGLPTSVFVRRDGTVAEIYVGRLPLESLEAKVLALVEE